MPSSFGTNKNYYEILQVNPTASPLDIKKSYRRLALRYHPDRNLNNNNNQDECTERFKAIGEAYEVLSDATKRVEYDRFLRYQVGGDAGNVHQQQRPHPPTTASYTPPQQYSYRPRQHFDPFAQFDNLFRTDPFFQAAFQDMDDEFARRFAKQTQPTQKTDRTNVPLNNNSSSNNNNNNSTLNAPSQQRNARSREGWLPWLLRQCGIEFHMTTYSSTGDGGFAASSYSSTNRDSYTDKKTRTYRDRQGRLVTIRSMERNGNQIQDTYIDQRLVERKVNGVVEQRVNREQLSR